MAFVTDLLNEMHFPGLVEQLPVGLLVADESHQLVLANQRAERLLGYASGELLGQNVTEICGPHLFFDPRPTLPRDSDHS